MSFFEELRRRNVFRVAVAYLVSAWVALQLADIVLESIEAPNWVIQAFMLAIGLGFVPALIFAWAFEMTPEGIKKEKHVDRSQSITQKTGQRMNRGIIVALSIAVALLLFDRFMPLGSPQPQVKESAAQVEEVEQAKSIAVLPFVNMSSDTEQEYFSDGISEEILNSLARVKELKVAGRTSSFAFKGKNQDLRQIGETLGVEHILEGSVRKSGTKVRITAQLIQVEDGFHLWSDTYDREMDDVFAIQDEIATAILTQLKAHLLDGEQVVVTTARVDSEAYDLYLLAKQRMYERTGPTIQSAAELLDRAIAIDDGYAPAYAQRGIATLLLSDGSGSYGEIPPEQAQSQGKLYLDKALGLDPELAEAWAGLGLYYLQGPTATSWQQGTEVLQKALSLNPGLIDASNWLNNAYQGLGKPAEARKVVMNMIERDPLYRPGVRNAINSFINFGEPELALAHLDRIRALIPNDSVIYSSEAAILRNQGHVAEAMLLADSAVELQASNSVARLTRSFIWLDTHQWERVAAEGEEWTPVVALKILGRNEEASILAFKRAEELADVSSLFWVLNQTGRSDEVVTYLEERWADLETLRNDFPSYSAIGDFMMLDVALAYSRTGNQQRFGEAMNMVLAVHDELKSLGVDNMDFSMHEASYQALEGNLQASLEYLDRAITQGFITTTRISETWPWLAPLEGDPRFEAIQTRMIEHLNTERAALGLDPVSA
jgi:TolB-like protein/tetratricopeptide (TPR) repeat protein